MPSNRLINFLVCPEFQNRAVIAITDNWVLQTDIEFASRGDK